MIGGDGDDRINGQGGADVMEGGAGDDSYYVDNVGDVVIETPGQGGNDRIFASVSYSLTGIDVESLTLLDGAASAQGNAAANRLTGTDGKNLLSGLGGDDSLYGGGGLDKLVGGDGADALYGDGGDDLLYGERGVDALRGGDGADILDGGTGGDLMSGGGGNDIYYVDHVGDRIVENGDEGVNDAVVLSISYVLPADAAVETLVLPGALDRDISGNGLNQTLSGSRGDNVLRGMGGDDYLVGQAGQDVLDGGPGHDRMNGGLGADRFLFAAPIGPDNVDRVHDFHALEGDAMVLDAAIFTGLLIGALPAEAFRADRSARDGSDRIIYDSETGALLFDADGNGAVAAIQFAILLGNPALNAGNFIIG
ncbi:calcium-binding protein [Sphingobium rhizovicinum]|uniref:Calcium-binding protein n=1 Tax=Sphingobium rhizovicinum TaxID=432308 RepID=A0ABV7ND92_9SPHN